MFRRVVLVVMVLSLVGSLLFAFTKAQTTPVIPKWQSTCGAIPAQTGTMASSELLRTNHDRCVNRVISEILEDNQKRWSAVPVEWFTALPALSVLIVLGIGWRIGAFR